jgi:hypothetical protein
MKKYYVITLFALCLLASCLQTETTGDNQELRDRIAALEKEMEEVKSDLAPGLAVLMNQNYDHLKKLDLAITNNNWEYADFCLHEMEETFEQIIELHNNHDELVQPADTQFKAFIHPVFHQLESAVDEKNQEKAKTLFVELKTNCSKCHTANNHGFIAL